MPVQINRATFLSVLEASRKLRVTPQTVRNYLRKGELDSIRVGRALLIPERNVHAFLDSLPAGPTSVNLT